MTNHLVKISGRLLAALWIVLLHSVNCAWSQPENPNFPTLTQVENLSEAARNQLGSPTAYVMCQDYANALYRLCLENRWSCIPQQVLCNPQGIGHALVLVQISATQCVFADPTVGTVIQQVFECAQVRNSDTVWLSGPVCMSGQTTCRCERSSAPGGWTITTNDPRYFATMASAYSEMYFRLARRMTRLQACRNACAVTVGALEQQAQGCFSSEAPRERCENFAASIPHWRTDCLRACETTLS
jgi:hypothetical protein